MAAAMDTARDAAMGVRLALRATGLSLGDGASRVTWSMAGPAWRSLPQVPDTLTPTSRTARPTPHGGEACATGVRHS